MQPARSGIRQPIRRSRDYAICTDGSGIVKKLQSGRAMWPPPMGRRSWLFCTTATCRAHGIDAYTYLVDVLQRVNQHPASRVAELTPRAWVQRFADSPLRSDLAPMAPP